MHSKARSLWNGIMPLKLFGLKALNGANNLFFYSDTCVSQNKNRYYLTMLWYCLKQIQLEKYYLQIPGQGSHRDRGTPCILLLRVPVEKSLSIPLASGQQLFGVLEKNSPTLLQKWRYIYFKFQTTFNKHKKLRKTTEWQQVPWNSIKILKLVAKTPNKFQYHTDYDREQFEVDCFQCIPNAKTLKGVHSLQNKTGIYHNLIRISGLR